MIPDWDDRPAPRRASPRRLPKRPWATWIALAALWFLTLTGQYWVFPVLFLGWAAYDIYSGESSFVQRVTKLANPVTYWLIVASWIVMSILWLLYPNG